MAPVEGSGLTPACKAFVPNFIFEVLITGATLMDKIDCYQFYHTTKYYQKSVETDFW
ncbi:MAG: hypothetical protein ACJAZM_001555 [Cyclobacteriaceae bacterium]|jgi:hypothetical protein